MNKNLILLSFLETIPVNLSVEEQNVKNSIMRLNEKLNSNIIFAKLFSILKVI